MKRRDTSNQTMERTADRCASTFEMTSYLHPERRAPSSAVAHLVLVRSMRALACLIVYVALAASAFARAHVSGRQPYLIFRVTQFEGHQMLLLGTLSKREDFQTYEASRDRLDSVSMHAKLIEETPEGFRVQWTILRRTRGKIVAHVSTKETIPWNKPTAIQSIPGYHVDVFYSSIPANDIDIRDLTNR
jgi:hypothetical protein